MKNIKAFARRILKTSLYIVAFVVTLVILAIVALFIWEPHIIQISSCLDRGGSWDYELEKCREASGYPMTPYDCILAKGDWIYGEGCKLPSSE